MKSDPSKIARITIGFVKIDVGFECIKAMRVPLTPLSSGFRPIGKVRSARVIGAPSTIPIGAIIPKTM